ncbi:MAG: SpaA isopeptide-forming pilin-related protein [Eubacteriales bacterium]|nr:SpaA isopeptide-forming pilin-related protein [Eubacteriales bacterium]
MSLLLALVTMFSLMATPAMAAVAPDNSGSLADGSSSVTIKQGNYVRILSKSTGGTIGGMAWSYTSDKNLTGPAYCVNWGLDAVSSTKRLEITGRYDRNPQTMGAFANGYPQRTLEQFKELHSDINGIANLTQTEYAYATQLAIWATCGQLAVPGTSFATGRASLVKPTSDAQKIRVYESVVEILNLAAGWSKQLYTGLYFHMEKDKLGNSISIYNEDGLEGAARDNQNGLKKETINGVEYYTRLMYIDSATSTYPNDYQILVYAMDAPSGTIMVNTNNQVFPSREQWGATMYEVPTPKAETTSLNANGSAYTGAFKICIPCNNVTDSGSIKVEAYAVITQFNLYLAYNPVATEQSYIIADPAYVGRFAEANIKWDKTAEEPETASLQVQKVDGGAMPLEGAEFELIGSKGTTRTGTSDQNGLVEWTDLPADESYTLSETKAPAGFTIVAPRNVSLTAGQTAYITIQDDTSKHFTIKKIDAQNGSTLEGAVFRFEQIDGDYTTTATTGFDGMIDFAGDELPFGSYRVSEERSPTGYEKDTSVQTVKWDGTEDVLLTFQNVRQPTIIVSKVDGVTGISLPGATFNIYKDGELIGSATTNDAGELRFPIVAGEGYFEFEETVAPAGYQLDRTRHGIYIDPYDPKTEDDPVLTIENFNNPSLRIIKYDQQSGDRLSGITFEIYHDGELYDTLTTDDQGEINLYNIPAGTWLVKEVSTDDEHVVNSTPQQIELKEGQQETQTLVFFNQLKPGIHLVKVDSQTMKPLPNVRFEFKKVGGSYQQEFLTDINGEIDLSKLEPGAYEVRELAGPEGYLMDDSVRIVQINPDENANFVFTNTPKPSLVIVKYDPNTGKYLPGATFRIAKVEDGSHYLDRVTGTDGRIVLHDLEPGVYSVQELEAPSGYVRNDTEYHVELFAGKESQLVVNNEAKPDLKIIKTDAVTGDPVEGVTFTIKKADSSTLLTATSDEKGEVFLEDLDPGVYEIWEQSVPDNYLISDKHEMITLEPNKLGVVQFQNYPKPGLTVNKVDSITGDPIKGAKFHVTYASNDTFSGEINDLGYYYSDENGQFSISKLQDGWYRVEEVEPASGYAIKDPAIQECYIKAGTQKTLTFENTPLSAIVIKKVDADTGAPLEGAWFRIRYLDGNSGTGGTTIGEYQTSSNGTIVVTQLKAGTYICEEIAAPDGYVINDSAKTVYLSGKDQDVVTVVFGNDKMGSLLILKKDASTGEPLSDVEFLVTSSDGGVIGNANGKYVTDSAGTIRIDGLEPGMTVVVKETRTREGYLLDDTPQTIKIKANETMTLEFRNAPKGNLIITKLDSVTKEPLKGVTFEIVYSDGSYVDAENGTLSSKGIYTTDTNGQIILSGINGTVVVTETKTLDGYTIDEDTRSQTVVVNPNDTQTITVYNTPNGGVELIKVNAAKKSERIPNTTFEIRRMDGGLVDTVTTDRNGRVFLALEDGDYYAVEIEAGKGFRVDSTPHYFTVSGGKTTKLTITNEAFTGVLIHKVDSVSGRGIPDVTFLVYDSKMNPIDQVTTDQNGYAYIDDLGFSGKLYLRELEAEGYIVDTALKTVYAKAGETVEVTWENTPITAQIQIWKKSADDNTINGFPAGTPLEGAVFEVYDKSNRLVETIKSDKRGLAVSSPLPLGRYTVKEVQSPSYYAVNSEAVTVYLEHSGQIVQIEMLNESVYTNVSIDKTGYAQVVPGQSIRYTFKEIGNNSSVAIDSFYWRDTLPTDAVRLDKIITGTWSARLNYKVVFQTNLNNTQRVLADNLNTQKNYTLDASAAALGLASNEYVTQVTFLFGQVPAGFKQVETPYIYCNVLSNLTHEYRFTNKCDVGGLWKNQWLQATDRWVTIVYRGGPTPTLPRTGY